MNMYILEEIHIAKNHGYQTRNVYQTAVKQYCNYHDMTLEELIEEAEKEEDAGIKWKHTKLKKRLITFRHYLIETHPLNTVRTYFHKITSIYDYYEISIGPLPRVNKKSYTTPEPIQFKDLPDKEIIREAINISTPVMKAIILFMTSSGCARTETLNLTIQDYINSLQDYTTKTDIIEIIDEINKKENIIPTFAVLRVKTNKYYTTYCSPEAVKAINSHILSRENIAPHDKLFKINKQYFIDKFQDLNDELGLGKVGKYNRLRSHMLRKFHASALYNDGMSIDKVNDLQGKAKNKTDAAYFMTNPEDLKAEYIEHLPALMMGKEVEKIKIKSPEYIRLESENKEYKESLEEMWEEINNIKKRNDIWDEL